MNQCSTLAARWSMAQAFGTTSGLSADLGPPFGCAGRVRQCVTGRTCQIPGGLGGVESLVLGRQTFPALGRAVDLRRVILGPCLKSIGYVIQTPYLALNQENHETWVRSGPAQRERLLGRIVVGNLLSLSKAI